MDMKPVQVRLSQDEISKIDHAAKSLRQSRSQFIAKAGIDRAVRIQKSMEAVL